AAFGFIIHRFNLAFERGLIADRIVDLVIAAESLFLRDIDSDERGELSFRLALRVVKFIEFPGRTEHDVFRLMRRAYKARSRIVHGGETGAAHPAEIATYIDDLETVVRLALRKAVAIEGGAALLRQPKYWESLVFATPIPELNRESTGS